MIFKLKTILFLLILVLTSALLRAENEESKYAYIQFLNKNTGSSDKVKIATGSIYSFDNSLQVFLRKCYKSQEQDKIENMAFLQIVKREKIEATEKPDTSNFLNDIIDIPKEFDKTRKSDEFDLFIFSGWLFSSSPSISFVKDKVYDVTLLKCSNS